VTSDKKAQSKSRASHWPIKQRGVGLFFGQPLSSKKRAGEKKVKRRDVAEKKLADQTFGTPSGKGS